MGCENMGSTIPLRFIIAAMMGLACLVYALNRGNMSIIILAMTKDAYNSSIELPNYGPRYEWTRYEQSLVLGSYFWGNTVACSFAGIFAGRYGARNILGCSFGFVAILLAVSSVAAQYLWLTIFIRFLTGVAMGAVTPSIQEIIRKWAPPDERGFFLSLLQFTGIGVVLDWSMSGHIIEQYGWNYAFYVVAVIFGIFTVLWFVIVYDSPREHPRITVLEKEYITRRVLPTLNSKNHWPPLRSIALSIPFWALLFFDVGNKYGYYFILTSVPRYLSEVHSFSITSTGLWASLPYLIRLPVSILFGYIGDLLVRRKTMRTNAIRKWFSICSHFIPGCFLIGVAYVGDHPNAALAFITCATCFHSAIVITTMSNVHDLAPNFASAICGLISLVGYSSGYVAPLVVAYFTRHRSTEEEWQKIFFVGAGIFISTNIIFILFGSGNVQKWNDVAEEAATSHENVKINVKEQ